MTRSRHEAETFDGNAHLHQLKETFETYDQDLYQWVIGSIADNCSMNKRLARLLDVSHVG